MDRYVLKNVISHFTGENTKTKENCTIIITFTMVVCKGINNQKNGVSLGKYVFKQFAATTSKMKL